MENIQKKTAGRDIYFLKVYCSISLFLQWLIPLSCQTNSYWYFKLLIESLSSLLERTSRIFLSEGEDMMLCLFVCMYVCMCILLWVSH